MNNELRAALDRALYASMTIIDEGELVAERDRDLFGPMTAPKEKPKPIPLAASRWACRACGQGNWNIKEHRHCARCGEPKE